MLKILWAIFLNLVLDLLDGFCASGNEDDLRKTDKIAEKYNCIITLKRLHKTWPYSIKDNLHWIRKAE
jgi:hypothetical protein